MTRFKRAIVRPPAPNLADGLTSVDLGVPDYLLALRQHDAYCEALKSCGLSLIVLEPDEGYPDSTFVEDTAVITERGAILSLPGAASRVGEVEEIGGLLKELFGDFSSISAPGTLDAGDVCEAGEHFFIGISKRTNEAGANQLAGVLRDFGYTSSLIDIRDMDNILHLKSDFAFLGNRQLVFTEALAARERLSSYDSICVPLGEEYAANCLAINDRVLIPAGFPMFEQRLRDLGFEIRPLEMSEFQKMDGGLSCLSLRF